MKVSDLPAIDEKVIGTIGLIVKVDRDNDLPLWEGGGNGIVAVIRYQGLPYLATKLTYDWLALIEVQLDC